MQLNDIENTLTNWDLFKSYGQFNIYFEAIVAQYRGLLIELVRRSYGFNGDWEDPETLEIIDSELQDRLLKIILNDDGATAIIEKCRACYIDSFNPTVQKVLIENQVEPLKISEFDLKFAEQLFKKTLELVKLRNVIIHSHYEGVLINFFPLVKLKSRKDFKIKSGYEERSYEYTIQYLNEVNNYLADLGYLCVRFSLNALISDGNDEFTQDDIDKITKMKFSPPKI